MVKLSSVGRNMPFFIVEHTIVIVPSGKLTFRYRKSPF